MPTRQKLVMSFLMVVVGWVFSHPVPAQSFDTAFTYQGRLFDTNSPAHGLYDFEFKLFDDPNTDGQVGSTLAKENTGVYEGFFTAILDFGDGVFDGTDLWMEIGIRAGELDDPNVYTTLNPRQKITASPYALYATSGTIPSPLVDIITGSIPFDNNPGYIVGIGLVKDVTSEIPIGFNLIDVTAKGRKTNLVGTLEEAPLNLYPKIDGTSIEILVWDADGSEYGDWPNKRAHIEYALFLKKSGPSGSSEIDKVIEDIAVVWDVVESKYLIPADYHVGDTGTLKVEHLPNLVAEIGGTTQSLIEASVKRLAIEVECYSENFMTSYVGPCWTSPVTLSEVDGKAYWSLEFKNVDGSSYSNTNWKLLKVTTYLK